MSPVRQPAAWPSDRGGVKVGLDAHLSPAIATWLASAFGVEASPVRRESYLTAKDREIFFAAREAGAVVMTKDADFVRLVEVEGPPPQVIWLTCGNTSNRALRRILRQAFGDVLELLEKGEALVEISDAR